MAYLARTLVNLRNEVNAASPGRDRTSDGWVGDASHAARPSDHNPDPPVIGVVRALDLDIDGISELDLIAAAKRHPATNYIIFDGAIYQRAYGFARRAYTGVNPHRGHVHISIRRGYEADSTRWLTPAPVVTVTNPIGGSGGSLPDAPTIRPPDPIAPIEPEDDEMKPHLLYHPNGTIAVLRPATGEMQILRTVDEPGALVAAGMVDADDTVDLRPGGSTLVWDMVEGTAKRAGKFIP